MSFTCRNNKIKIRIWDYCLLNLLFILISLNYMSLHMVFYCLKSFNDEIFNINSKFNKQ